MRVRKQRWIVRIDTLTDDDLAFFGWVAIAKDDEFTLYQRSHDGEQQVVANDPPRWLSVDDFNDAQQINEGDFPIIQGPPVCH